ncbi:porin family protein [Zunongwangia endophytica]|uniref:Porin family protein n=1 Tax=Zunongwangia endophytica TaxID=1808945 RepID=A0ABV8H4R4_9FLAO|nr:porin family protein [Zunongwangia endophytica]MDN3595678.1 porin family protein [Zunongwangia endophytica]
MKYKFLILLFFGFAANAQRSNPAFSDSIPTVIDSSYREDQFYFGLSFNFITDQPDFLDQNGFSAGLSGGFIRDIPLNKDRNVGIGIGLGLAFDSFGQNLFIGEDQDGNSIFRNLNQDDIDYNSNRFNTFLIEAPIQFRWRTSTFTSYKFWRIYTGLKLGYIYHFRSAFKQEGNTVKQSDVAELERFRLGASFTFGYSTFNFQIYYGLNPFFKGVMVEGEDVNISTLRVGLMFYIL